MDLLLKNLPTLNNHFHLHNKIGQGTFSNVYLATLRNSDSSEKFAVKHLIQACEQSRIESELKCLKDIGGKDNVVSAELCLTNGNDCVAFVMPYLPHLKFADYVSDMDVEETRLYMKNLFVALKRVHSFNIIHRDVKPDNFLYNREKKQFLLVDFGLAQLVRNPNDEISKNSVADENCFKRNFKNRKRSLHCNDDDTNTSSIGIKRIALKAKENDSAVWNSPKILTEKENNENKCKFVLNLQSRRAHENIFEIETTLSDSNVASAKISSSNFINSLRANKLLKTSSLNDTKFESGKNSTNQKMMGNLFFTSSQPPKTSNISSFQIRNGKMTKIQKASAVLPSEFISSKKHITSTLSNMKACSCSGKAGICPSCSLMERMDAPRGGTSGFRAPEVLFRYLYQTTAVDMWASGVIMLCILSGCYPFFNSTTDLLALAEIMTIFGTDRTINVAAKFGRRIVCSEKKKGIDLKKLCYRLRNRASKNSKTEKNNFSDPKCRDCFQTIQNDGCLCITDELSKAQDNFQDGNNVFIFPDSAFDLLNRLLDLDPTTRITAAEALEHPFIIGIN